LTNCNSPEIAPAVEIAAVPIAAVVPLHVTFAELSDDACRFETTIGHVEPAAMKFCGQPAAPRRPFCPAHAAIVYMPAAPPMKRRSVPSMPMAA
jgi:hypothetical protein